MLRRAWRRSRGWWLLTAAAAVSAIVGLIAQSLPVLTGSLLVGAIGGLAGIAMVHAQRAIDRGDAAPGMARRLQRVRDLRDPVSVGIHPALPPVADEQVIPPFVPRDQSAVLEDLLGVSRFVLVVGESTAGKSRMAYEAMRSRLPGHVFIHPQGKHDLADALQVAGQHRQGVLWLDNLESYLGIGGLTPDALTPLLSAPGRHTVVLATMRAHQRASYTQRQAAGIPTDEGSALVLAGKVLALAREVRVERQWSRAELDRAADSGDGRIGRALERAGEFGVAQYLAAAPELFRLWQDNRGSAPEGQPRGVALVAAAVDARRAGYHRGIPLDVLKRLHEFYLGESTAHIRLETWDEAVAWAMTPLYSTSSLLMPDGKDAYVAFDYLGDAVDGTLPVRELPPGVWDELISFVPADDVMEVAWSAFYRSRPVAAETALQKAFDAGHYEAALDFAYMMAEGTERADDVVAWLDRAISRADGTTIPAEQILELRDQLAWWVGGRYAGSGDPARARQLAQDVVDESARLLGEEHPQTLASRITPRPPGRRAR